MDGEIAQFDSDLNRGDILGADKRRYGFVTAEWHSSGRPERGNAVRFVANDDRATQIYLLFPAHAAPLSPSEAIDAVYTIALGKAGGEDLFGAAPILWRSYFAPMLILLALGEVQLLLGGGLPIDWQQVTFPIGVLLFVIIVLGLLILLGVAIGVVALLGRLMGEHGRIGAGVLAYVWVQAVLVQPTICLMRLILGPRDPTIVIVLLVLGLVAVIIAAGRVVKSGFQLNSVGAGIFIVVAAGFVGFVLDRVVG